MNASLSSPLLLLCISCCLLACRANEKVPSKEVIDEMNLKTGSVISCGPAESKYGSLLFPVSATEKIQEDFNLGVKLLHSFEYDEAEKVFAKIIQDDPACAMAYWGVAMSNFHPLWMPPTEPELEKGSKAIQLASSIKNISGRESDYILYYSNCFFL
jgi:hypothetical protein